MWSDAGNPMTHIGLFLGYSVDVGEHFDGEGIGRFIIRLIDGLLHYSDSVVVHVATNDRNYQHVERAFQRNVSPTHMPRLFHHQFNTVDWVNQNVPVAGWIVPYIGIETAVELTRPFVVCLHDLVYMHFRDIYDKTYPDLFEPFGRTVNVVASRAAKVVFHSEYTRTHEGLTFLKLPRESTYVIRLAAPGDEYRAFGVCEEDIFRSRYGLPRPYIVYPSIIRLHKNHERLIQSFLNFRQSHTGSKSHLKLVITDEYHNRPRHEEIEKLLAECKSDSARNSVIFLGRIAAEDLPSLYKYSMGAIVPTLFEGSFPFQILESIVMKTPVAVSRIEVIGESLASWEPFITFDPYSTPQIESAILKLWKIGGTLVAAQEVAAQHLLSRTWMQVAADYYQLVMSTVH